MLINHRTVRPGLTLLELIMVLIILVALAGIVLPMFPDLITRSRTATGAANIHEVVKAVDTYKQLDPKNWDPDGWDTLTDGTTLVDYLPAGSSGPGGGRVIVDTSGLTKGELRALNDAGITRVHFMFATQQPPAPPAEPFSTTFNPYSAPVTPPHLLSTGDKLAILAPTPAALQVIEKMGLAPSSNKYVLFGVGRRSSLVGKTIREVPVTGVDNPEVVYARILVIYEVPDLDVVADARARLVGAVALQQNDLPGIAGHIQGYHKAVSSGN